MSTECTRFIKSSTSYATTQVVKNCAVQFLLFLC